MRQPPKSPLKRLTRDLSIALELPLLSISAGLWTLFVAIRPILDTSVTSHQSIFNILVALCSATTTLALASGLKRVESSRKKEADRVINHISATYECNLEPRLRNLGRDETNRISAEYARSELERLESVVDGLEHGTYQLQYGVTDKAAKTIFEPLVKQFQSGSGWAWHTVTRLDFWCDLNIGPHVKPDGAFGNNHIEAVRNGNIVYRLALLRAAPRAVYEKAKLLDKDIERMTEAEENELDRLLEHHRTLLSYPSEEAAGQVTLRLFVVQGGNHSHIDNFAVITNSRGEVESSIVMEYPKDSFSQGFCRQFVQATAFQDRELARNSKLRGKESCADRILKSEISRAQWLRARKSNMPAPTFPEWLEITDLYPSINERPAAPFPGSEASDKQHEAT